MTRFREWQAQVLAIQEALFDLEPELQRLNGVVALLRALALTAEPIEPVAMAVLADFADDAVRKAHKSWKAGLDHLGDY